MSRHFAEPRITENHSHELSIFRRFIDVSSIDMCIVKSVPKSAEQRKFAVSYDHRKMKFLGDIIDTCTKTGITYFKDSKGCYYAINTIKDHGDEGYIIPEGFYFSEFDIFESIRNQFDSVEQI